MSVSDGSSERCIYDVQTMLRCIFSLIHRIIDSDKKYNNTKSKALIHCCSSRDSTITMDLQLDGMPCKPLKNSIEYQEKPAIEQKTFTVKTEQGDTVVCTHNSHVDIVPKGSKEDSKTSVRVSFSNTDDDQSHKEVDSEVQPNVQDLIEHFPMKRMELSSTEKDQISSLLEQIQKMKTGLQRLQEIAVQFNNSERFSEDINYLVQNVRPHLKQHAESEPAENQNISPQTDM